MEIRNYDFAGKKAIVRVDFNVPIQDGRITDDTRIRGAVPTLKLILEKGGALIIMSHMGKPKGKVKPELSLSQIKEAVAKALGVPEVKFAPDCAHADAEVAALKPGEVLLLENLRYYPEEEGKPVGIDKEDPAYEAAKKEMKEKQKEFAKKLASYADCYVMDAFGTAHRKHASTAVIADYFADDDKMLGLLMEKEVNAVDNVLSNIKRPFVAIMGGSKVSTKIGIIENLLGKVDRLILCGGMTYTFVKAHGGEIGSSIVELDKLDVALGVEELAKKNGVELVLCTDSVVTNGLDFDTMTVKDGAEIKVCPSNAIPEGFEGVDAGPQSRERFAAAIKGAKTILWNGPAGVFECDAFAEGSKAIGQAVAEATAEGAFSLIGGGDSVACVNKFGLVDKVSYISTGGGALLEAIEGKVLPELPQSANKSLSELNDWKKRLGMVYSTNPNFQFITEEEQEPQTLEPSKQRLIVSIDRSGRAGKQVTLVKGFVGTQEDLAALGKQLKVKCGVGGTAKDGEITIQGDLRDKVTELLKGMGYNAKRGN